MRRRTLLGADGAGLAASLGSTALVGCGSSDGGGSGAGKPLVAHLDDTGSWQRNFNPFAVTANIGTIGLFYEPLLFFNSLEPGDVTPWLATGHTWSDGGKTLTVPIRDKVTWSDGKPLTADDVVFTYQTMVSNPALNTNGLAITKVAAQGNSVVFTFATPSYTKLWNLAGRVGIVPRHLLSGKDLTTYTNPNPVGTGPFTLGSFSAQLIEVTANPTYWQGRPKVPSVKFPAYSASSVQTGLQTGEIDWASAFVPDLKKIYIRDDAAHNKYYFPPDGLVALIPNLARPPFDNLAVRQAISLAIDRDAVVKGAERGYVPAAHPSGLPIATSRKYVPEKYVDAKFTVDTGKARQLLASAGYGGGKRLAIELLVPSPYTDYVNGAQLIRDNLAAVGVDVTVRGVAIQDWVAKAGKGDFQLTIRGIIAGPTPFYLYRSMLSSALSAPVGQQARGDYERWQDAATDKLLADYEGTDDEAKQIAAVQGLATTVIEKLPVIPLFGSPNWGLYRTSKYTGWPSAADPYAMPSPAATPDLAVVLLHLKPA
jgi:peptide/nickel transport system substrate-binding protein